MQEFQNIAQSGAFNSNEVALFHTLLHMWNAARRPAVIEQWAETSCTCGGLTKHTLPAARNKLIQMGVLHFDKTGRRSKPRYSFNAILGLPSPFLCPPSGNESGIKPESSRFLCPPSGNQSGIKPESSRFLCPPSGNQSGMKAESNRNESGMKADSYQVEEKVEEREQESALAQSAPPPKKKTDPPIHRQSSQPAKSDFPDSMPTGAAQDMDALVAKINALHPLWKRRPNLGYQEMSELAANSKAFFALEDRDWSMIAAYLDFCPTPEYRERYKPFQPDSRSLFIRAITDITGHADRWAAITKWEVES